METSTPAVSETAEVSKKYGYPQVLYGDDAVRHYLSNSAGKALAGVNIQKDGSGNLVVNCDRGSWTFGNRVQALSFIFEHFMRSIAGVFNNLPD